MRDVQIAFCLFNEANYFQNQEFIQYYGFTKETYGDAKMKKLEEFWREIAVEIGLYNECVLWWGV